MEIIIDCVCAGSPRVVLGCVCVYWICIMYYILHWSLIDVGASVRTFQLSLNFSARCRHICTYVCVGLCGKKAKSWERITENKAKLFVRMNIYGKPFANKLNAQFQ